LFCAPLNSPCDDIAENAPDVLLSCARAFAKNVRGLCAALTLPYYLSVSGEVRRRYQQFYSAEKIRSLKSDYVGDAREIANAKFSEHMEDPKVTLTAMTHARDHLFQLAEADDEVVEGAVELLRQGVVLTWGSFEVFVSDAVMALVNADAALALRVCRSQTPAIRKLASVDVPLEAVLVAGGDLRGRIAEIIFDEGHIDSLPLMKSLLDELFPSDAALRDAFGSRILWTLFQQRHLIVHRRGVVDAKYREATGDDLPLGSELRLTHDDVRSYLDACRAAVRQLIASARSALARSTPST
jgi:hypothetical protein